MRTKLEYLAKQTAKEDQCLTVIFMDWWCDQNFKLGETKFTTVETKTNGDVLRTPMELEFPQKRSRIENAPQIPHIDSRTAAPFIFRETLEIKDWQRGNDSSNHQFETESYCLSKFGW